MAKQKVSQFSIRVPESMWEQFKEKYPNKANEFGKIFFQRILEDEDIELAYNNTKKEIINNLNNDINYNNIKNRNKNSEMLIQVGNYLRHPIRLCRTIKAGLSEDFNYYIKNVIKKDKEGLKLWLDKYGNELDPEHKKYFDKIIKLIENEEYIKLEKLLIKRFGVVKHLLRFTSKLGIPDNTTNTFITNNSKYFHNKEWIESNNLGE